MIGCEALSVVLQRPTLRCMFPIRHCSALAAGERTVDVSMPVPSPVEDQADLIWGVGAREEASLCFKPLNKTLGIVIS